LENCCFLAPSPLIDSLVENIVTILWVLAAIGISDRAMCQGRLVQAILDSVFSDSVPIENRSLLGKFLVFLNRIPGKTQRSSTIGDKWTKLVSETHLPEIVIHFLGSESETLRAAGAGMLSQIESTTVGQALIRENGGIKLLLDLTDGSMDTCLEALRGLRHVVLEKKSQVFLCKAGLYQLLKLSWTIKSLQHREIIADILQALSQNKKNRDLMYRAELRARAMFGWRDARDPHIDAQIVTTSRSRISTELKDKFLKWLKSLEDPVFSPSELSQIRRMQRKHLRLARVLQKRETDFEKAMRSPSSSSASNSSDNDERKGSSCNQSKRPLETSLSGFIRDFQKKKMQAEEEISGLQVQAEKSRPSLAAIQRIKPQTLRLSSPKQAKSSPGGRNSPRERNFQVFSPEKSPFCELRGKIPCKKSKSKRKKNKDTKNVRRSGLHSKRSKFSSEEHAEATRNLRQCLAQPMQNLWGQDEVAPRRSHWNPEIKSISASKIELEGGLSFSFPKKEIQKPRNEGTPGSDEFSSDDLEEDEASSDAPEPVSRYEFKRRLRSERVAKLKILVERKRHAKLAKFSRIPGSKLQDGSVPVFQLPDGKFTYLYFSGDIMVADECEEHIRDVDAPNQPPVDVASLGFEKNSLPQVLRLLSEDKSLPTPSEMPQPERVVRQPLTETRSLEPFQDRQPVSLVRWNELGEVQDEMFPILICTKPKDSDVDEDDDEFSTNSDGETWSLEQSVFAPRGCFSKTLRDGMKPFRKTSSFVSRKKHFRKSCLDLAMQNLL